MGRDWSVGQTLPAVEFLMHEIRKRNCVSASLTGAIFAIFGG